MKILIVDINKEKRQAVASLLENKGYGILEAEDIQGATALFEKKISIVVFKDLDPFDDGPALCSHIRKTIDAYYVYCILLAKADTEIMTKGLAAGTDAVLPADADLKTIITQINAGVRILKFHRMLKTVESAATHIAKAENNTFAATVRIDPMAQAVSAALKKDPVWIQNTSKYDRVRLCSCLM